MTIKPTINPLPPRMKLLFPIFMLLAALPLAGRLQSERAYQEWFAKKVNGKLEVVMGDGTRCDLLTSTHAIEVDFADKWAEAVGQSLNYSFQSNRKAGIVLIVEKQSDYKHLVRLNSLIRHHKLDVEVWPIFAYKGEGPSSGNSASAGGVSSVGERYWITSTGITHNSSCRYFAKTKSGKRSGKGTGRNCKLCGGVVE